ncbi:MAG: phosphatase PAP2 family protein [Eubacteriales bacterium]|nr:phosphatase PAP2 family protein [Eubacteriales bacterium]
MNLTDSFKEAPFMQAFSNFEGGFLLFVQEHLRVPALDGVMTSITHLGDTGAIWIALALILLVIPRTRKAGIVCAAALVLNLLLTNIALKNIIQRIRPYDVMESLKILVEAEHDFSFPSGHTACSFAGAWAMRRTLDKKFWIPAMVLAVLISLSRLYVGVHYPTDILGGVIVGTFAAEAVYRLIKKFVPKFQMK